MTNLGGSSLKAGRFLNLKTKRKRKRKIFKLYFELMYVQVKDMYIRIKKGKSTWFLALKI